MRARLRKRLFVLIERYEDWLLDQPWWERTPEWFYDGQRLACTLLGHRPIPDQCDKPEHDVCAFCSTRTPYKAER